MAKFMQSIYVKVRQKIRKFVIRHKVLDHYLGNMLVDLDMLIRKTGILNSKLRKGFIDHNNFRIHFGQGDSSLISFLVTNNDYETETRKAIERILKLGDVFVDLGANIGFFSLIAARIVGPEGKVYAFEPTPITTKYLVKNISDNDFDDRVVIEQYAVSDRCGKVRFSLNQGSESNRVCVGVGGDTIEVDTIGLDEYFLKYESKRIDLIKMDIEGQELPALLGLKELNAFNKELKVIFEFHKGNLEENGLTGLEIFSLLQDYGFNRFTVLFRKPYEVLIPDDFHIIQSEANRENLNILAEKIII